MKARRATDEPQTRREAEIRWTAHEADHKQLNDGIQVALDAVERERKLHVEAHEAGHIAHTREHALDEKGATQINEAHGREHALEADALDKAAAAVDKRLEGMNDVRSQLHDQAATFARVEVVQALTDRIIAIEKLDIKSEGKGLGQGAVVAYIVTAVSVAGAILGIIVVLSNLVTTR
jgi:hypothetical protein